MAWGAVAAAAAQAAGQYAQARMQQNSQNSAQGRANAIQFLMNDYFQNKQIAWEKERATHAHQWEMQDLKNAGLNPALTATGGSGATTGSISAPTSAAPDFQGLQMGTFTDMISKLVEMRNNTKATNANSNLADSQAIEALAHADNMPKELRIKAFDALSNRITANANTTNAVTNRNVGKTQEYKNWSEANNQNWQAEEHAEKTKYQRLENKWYEKNHFRTGIY